MRSRGREGRRGLSVISSPGREGRRGSEHSQSLRNTLNHNNNNNNAMNATSSSWFSQFNGTATEMLLPTSSSSAGAASLAAIASPCGGMGFGCREPAIIRKRRGRPRKYNIDNSYEGGRALMPTRMSRKIHSCPDKQAKKAQRAALGSAGQNFTPHIVNIAAGEDVYEKILVFSQGPGAIFIISANGAISKAIFRQKTYEGRFEIHSLSGSFVRTEVEGSPVGGLSVSFIDPVGNVVGGAVFGCLMAATPVQVIVGTFLVDSKKTIVRTRKSELFTDNLPASLLEVPPSPAVSQSAPETFGNLSAGQNGYCAQTTGSCSYSQQSQVLNMMSLYQNWGPSQFENEMNNMEATTGARTKRQDGGYKYQGEDDEEEDFGE